MLYQIKKTKDESKNIMSLLNKALKTKVKDKIKETPLRKPSFGGLLGKLS